jgi:hypothetical protein
VIACTNYVPLILAAVGFAGFGAAGQAISTVYISEISHVSNQMKSQVFYKLYLFFYIIVRWLETVINVE